MASTPYSDINLPKLVTDPLYTSSQDQLNTLGTNLITGQGAPGAYSSIGQANSPAFQTMLNGMKGQIMQGSQEASAINGTGRSGTAVTASNNALNNVLPQLTYQDFLNSQSQQMQLLNTGIGVQSGVRGTAQDQQQFDSNFNQTLFNDQVGLASKMDAYKQQASAATGQAIGTGIQDAFAVGAAPFTGGASLAGLNLNFSGAPGGTGTPGFGQDFNSIISGLGSFNKSGSSDNNSDPTAMLAAMGGYM